MSPPYETFDKDLREGKAREDAFVHVLLRSRVEHKRDKKAARTGNIAFEVEQVCSDGVIRPSGIMSTEASMLAIEFFPECWVMLPKGYAQSLARKGLKEGLGKWVGDGGNHHNVLVPIEWLVRLPTVKSSLALVSGGGL